MVLFQFPVPLLLTGVVGDVVIVRHAGGAWTAELCCGANKVTCSPCAIPKYNLTLTIAGTAPFCPGGPYTLVYSPPDPPGNPSDLWQTTTTTECGIVYVFRCQDGALTLEGDQPAGVEFIGMDFLDCTSDPFHAHFVLHATFGGTEYYIDE